MSPWANRGLPVNCNIQSERRSGFLQTRRRSTAVYFLTLLFAAALTMPSARAQDTERSGKQVVTEICAECHEQGLKGAPKIGDRRAWVQRLKHGTESAVHSAIRGHGGMPPRGGQVNLTDMELRSAILYMFYPDAVIAKPSCCVSRTVQSTGANPNYKIVGGIGIYLGLMPAEKLRELPAGSPERTMHGGVPKGAGYYHVNVSLYDAVTGAPIKDAHVQMQFDQLGLGSVVAELEPMAIGLGSYGNYVKPQARTPYRITLQILRPKATRTVDARFEAEFFE